MKKSDREVRIHWAVDAVLYLLTLANVFYLVHVILEAIAR